MRVVVLFNQPVLPPDHPEAVSERGVTETVHDLSRLLSLAGFRVSRLGVGRDLVRLQSELSARQPDAVFNLFEGHADQPESEIVVARLLDKARIPSTGSGSWALRCALNKHLAKRRLRAAGVPTPWSMTANSLPLPELALPWPLIVKPARRDASEGIDQESVVMSPGALAERVALVLDRFGPPVLIEEFILGREFSVSLIEAPELTPLPITEVRFAVPAAGQWPILTYAAKWQPGSTDYVATPIVHGAAIPEPLAHRLITLASQAFHTLDCRDYARIDFRVTLAGEPFVLEVNANPDLSPTACFIGAISAAGLDRGDVMARFVWQAAARGRASRAARWTRTHRQAAET